MRASINLKMNNLNFNDLKNNFFTKTKRNIFIIFLLLFFTYNFVILKYLIVSKPLFFYISSVLFIIIVTFSFIEYRKIKKFKIELSLNNKLLHSIIDNLPFLICLKDLNGNTLLSNINSNNINVKNLNFDNIFSEMYYIEKDNKIHSSNKKDNYIEKNIKTTDGNYFWWKIFKIPIYNDNRDISNIMFVAFDINKEKTIQEQKTSLVATLTHDLKTPISAQINALNILQKPYLGELNKDQIDIIAQIKESCEYTKNIVHTILDTYLYENGQMKIKPENFKWKNLVAEVVAETSILAKNKAQKIIIDSDFKENEIFADRFQIKRVVENLISNAIQYGINNTKIEIYSNQDDKNLIFNVKNISRYIKKDYIKNVYNKFQSDSKTKTNKNCGLGLYLVKQIITAHNGYVFAKSDESGVCNFGFVIPKKMGKINFNKN